MIRSAHIADAPAIGELKVRAWRAAYSGVINAPFLAALDPAQEATDWREYLTDLPAAHRLWIVESNGVVAGFCRTGPAGEDSDLGPAAAEIYGLYLDPLLVGTGLGRPLFSHAVADLKARGHFPICVYAYEPNRRAIAFYERAGFRADGVTRLDEQDGTRVPEIRFVLA